MWPCHDPDRAVIDSGDVVVIVLVRHGRTRANAQSLLLGRSDVALDDLGRRQANALAGCLGPASASVRRIVSSPLQRCTTTAEVLAAQLDCSVAVDERWIELDYGEFEGAPLSTIPAETWAAWRGDVTWAPPGGESMAALGARVRAACEELALAPGVLVVSHVSPIKAAAAWALGVGDDVTWRMFLAPASITRIAVGDDRRVLQSFNEVGHLDGVE
jgi:broad specificity phosphatase PhoE